MFVLALYLVYILEAHQRGSDLPFCYYDSDVCKYVLDV